MKLFNYNDVKLANSKSFLSHYRIRHLYNTSYLNLNVLPSPRYHAICLKIPDMQLFIGRIQGLPMELGSLSMTINWRSGLERVGNRWTPQYLEHISVRAILPLQVFGGIDSVRDLRHGGRMGFLNLCKI